MKTKISFFTLFAVAITVSACNHSSQQNGNEPWTEKQLMPPSELATLLNNPSAKKPIIYSIGFGGGIKGSVEMGAAQENEGIENLKNVLSKLPKDADLVIYCGCCPFKDCPNIRPAFRLLNEMKFTNHKLLNLSHNLKVDWIDKGYPINE